MQGDVEPARQAVGGAERDVGSAVESPQIVAVAAVVLIVPRKRCANESSQRRAPTVTASAR